MAIAFDAVSSGSAANTNSAWSHSASGTNRIVFVLGTCDNVNSSLSATYNGVAMTKISQINGASDYTEALFYLINPPTGSQTINVNGSSGGNVIGSAVSYTGATQSGQPDSFNTGTSNSSGVTVSTTVVASGCWLIGGGGAFGGGGTLAAGNTGRTSVTISGPVQNILQDSNGTVGTGSQSLNWTGGAEITGIVASFSTAATTTTSTTLTTSTTTTSSSTSTSSSTTTTSSSTSTSHTTSSSTTTISTTLSTSSSTTTTSSSSSSSTTLTPISGRGLTRTKGKDFITLTRKHSNR